jgi:hypothetical protein
MTDRSASPASVDASALEIMLRDLRECGANRGEPCGVHERPQWTCAFCLHNLLAPFERVAAAPRAPLEPREDEIGLSVDMLDVDRLRKWAENVETYGPDLTLWAYPQFVSEWLRGLADRLDTTVRDIGVLRATRPRPALPQEPQIGSDASAMPMIGCRVGDGEAFCVNHEGYSGRTAECPTCRRGK